MIHLYGGGGRQETGQEKIFRHLFFLVAKVGTRFLAGEFKMFAASLGTESYDALSERACRTPA